MTFSAEAYYRPEHGDHPVILRTGDDIDTLVDVLLAESFDHSIDSQTGTWFSQGTPSDRDEVFYCHMGEGRDFPLDSELPIDLIRQATKEFLTSGGQRPTCVQWQPHRTDQPVSPT